MELCWWCGVYANFKGENPQKGFKMYAIGGYIFGALFFAVLVMYWMAVLINHLIGWVNDEKRDLLGRKILKKLGEDGDDGVGLFLKSLVCMVIFILVAMVAWPFVIFAGFVTAAVFALRYFNRFKRRVDEALGKAKK